MTHYGPEPLPDRDPTPPDAYEDDDPADSELYLEDEDDGTCPKCGGSGGGPDPGNSCSMCRGTGQVPIEMDNADRD